MIEHPQLLDLVEEALDSGRSPEEVCAQWPDLVSELRRRLVQCQVIEGELAALFPSDSGPSSGSERQTENASSVLPDIPGYELHSILGHGGMGVVYKARHQALKRFVAVKMLLSGVHASANERARLKREAEALAKLQHLHIVQVYDVGEFQGRPFFTMEFMGGGNLADELAGIPQGASQSVAMLIRLAGAVSAAHQCGIIHRDLKPANVLLTPDGVPKVSDFGLARELEDANLITFPGGRMGTPSYMAPEQASTRWGNIGLACDIYALGAILYEMMTGRPPFRGESAADTERQVIHQEPVPPTRLNPRTPRDLETICLKCLQKDPRRRYDSAAAMADDLGRFQRGEPISARRVGYAERGVKWIRRRPAVAIFLGSTAIFGMLLAAAATAFFSERATARRAVEADLAEAVRFQQESSWDAAAQALEHAKLQLGEQGPDDLRRRWERARHDSDLVVEIEKVQNTQAQPDYAPFFEAAGLGTIHDDPKTVAARVQASNIRSALIVALDNWAYFADATSWMLKVLRYADHDPTGWRGHVRDPATWENREALSHAAAGAPIADQPASFLALMAKQLHTLGENQIPLLARIQQAHPGDYWINLRLADALADADQGNNPIEAIRYHQAAEGIRPNASLARNNIANAYRAANMHEDALREFREAVRLDPGPLGGQINLGAALNEAGHHAEAIPVLEDCIRRDPQSPFLYFFLGTSVAAVGREADAIPILRKVTGPPGTLIQAKAKIRDLLFHLERWDEIEHDWQFEMNAAPTNHEIWNGYAEFCLLCGKEDEYRRACRELLNCFGQSDDAAICERTGRSCLLLGEGNPEIPRAVAAVDRAIANQASKPSFYHRYFMFAKALADYRTGQFEEAAHKAEGDAAPILGPAPKLVAALARYRLGQQDVARKQLVDAILSFDWSPANQRNHEIWMYHILRREAERLMIPNLQEIVDGAAPPQDNDERLAALGYCQFAELQGRRAVLWIDAFKADSDLPGAHLEDAARAAALGGIGKGKDAAKFTDDDRARWREAAVELLSKRVDALDRLLSPASPKRAAIQSDLLALEQNPDLAGLREPAAVARLPKAEQAQCAALWTRIREVLARADRAK